jgi:oxaloacetate decarboxylase (Na+ extruding) subunit alpha
LSGYNESEISGSFRNKCTPVEQVALMSEVYFVNTTFRDGHMSLWSERMTTGMILPVVALADRAGFVGMEIISTSIFKKCVRELREDPWERIRLVAQRAPKTPLASMMARSISSFQLTPRSVLRLWVERLAANGIKRLQLMDPANDMVSLVPHLLSTAQKLGIEVVLAVVYSLSPKHSDEYFAQKVRAARALKPTRIYLKDPSGLLTPERVQTLIPVFLKNAGGIPVELHSHCTTGLAPLCYLEAIKLGIETVHAAIPPLANGSSNPSLWNIINNVRALSYTPVIDESVIKPIEEHLMSIAKREGLPAGAPLEYDHAQFMHQVPGGVISNLRFQLAQLRMAERLDEVLEEVVRVRADLGYPIMVTPFSQFVVSQAAINVMLGERYREVTDEVIQYALGFWGEEQDASMDREVKAKILDRPRAREFVRWTPPEPTLKEVRERVGGVGVSDDEFLLRCFLRPDEIETMKHAGPPKEYLTAKQPVTALIRQLTLRKSSSFVRIQKPGLSLTLGNGNTNAKT